MRDLVVFLLFVVALPMSFMRPWLGLCVFSWLAYHRTQDLAWGWVRGLPLSQFIAIAMILGWMVREFRPLPLRDRRMQAMVGIVVVVALSVFMNRIRWPLQSAHLADLGKVIFVALLTAALITSRARLRQITAVICLALGFYGAKNGLMYWLTGSESIVGPGGMLADNNNFSLAMVMNVPFLWYLSDEMRQIKKYGPFIAKFMRVTFWLSLLTIVSTGSRGAFLSVVIVFMAMAWKTKWKIPALAGFVLLGLIGMAMAPKEYKDRILSMFAEQKDASIEGRLVSWKVAANMIKDNPVWGIGFQNMVFEYNNYTRGILNEQGTEKHFARVAHNSYLQLWAESGTIAYLLFMFMLIGSILALEATWRRAKWQGDLWIIPYCHAIQVSMVGFLVGATFLNRAHFDLIYQLVAITAVLPAVVRAERQRPQEVRRRTGPRIAQEVTVSHGGMARTPVR